MANLDDNEKLARLAIYLDGVPKRLLDKMESTKKGTIDLAVKIYVRNSTLLKVKAYQDKLFWHVVSLTEKRKRFLKPIHSFSRSSCS